MHGEHFTLETKLKEIDKPEKCTECECTRILQVNYKDLPFKKVNGFQFSNRYGYMCNGCGHFLGMVKTGIDPEMYIKTRTDHDHGEKYNILGKVKNL